MKETHKDNGFTKFIIIVTTIIIMSSLFKQDDAGPVLCSFCHKRNV